MESLDTVISVQPYGIAGLKYVVNRVLGAQLRVMPTDLGVADWLTWLPAHRADDISMRFDLSVDDHWLSKQLLRKKQHNVIVVGLQVAPEFQALGAELRDPARREAAVQKCLATLTRLSQGSFSPGDKAVPLVLGGKGIRARRYLNYVEALLKDGPRLVKGSQRLHILLVGVRGDKVPSKLEYGVESGVSQLCQDYPKSSECVVVHRLPRLPQVDIARLLATNVGIIKPGGLTTLELTALGCKALISMHLSKHLRWERGNACFLERNGLGFPLPTSEYKEREALASTLVQAWNSPTRRHTEYHFQTIYPKVLAHDAIARLREA